MPATTRPDAAPAAATTRHLPSTMRVVRADRYGRPGDVLAVGSVPRPEPGAGEVLVRVRHAGLSRAALHLTTGTPYLLRVAGFGLRAPKHPVGVELAGTVAAVGAGADRFSVGDEVFGYAKGTCAEFAVARADKLAHRPDALPPVAAAALVDSASTALQAVRDRGAVQEGQRVLVLGASGGVGSFAVQLAHQLGAEVTGTASTAKLDFVRSLGASRVVDHSAGDALATEQPYDVIIDTGGNRPVKHMLAALSETGTLVMVGGEEGGNLTGGFQRQLLAPLRATGGSQSVTAVLANEHHRFLDDLAAMAAAGRLEPAIDQVHALEAAARGLERMEAGVIRGKDVVEVRPEVG